jgi:hypothetical protein
MKEEKKIIKVKEGVHTPEIIDIFEEAAKQTIVTTKRSLLLKEETITDTNLTLPTNKKTRKNWNQLKKAIDSEHAERFNNILNNLPDREFARVYLKSLEFFKPKVIRQSGDKQEIPDQRIQIEIKR